MFCTVCAFYNPATLLNCESCGTSLQHSTSIPATTRDYRDKRTIQVWLAIVPIVMLLLLSAIVVRDFRHEQSTRADAYSRAERALAAGDYPGAISGFAAAGDYQDAAARRDEAIAAIEPYRNAYLSGVNALDTGDYDLAISSLVTVVSELPAYEDASTFLDQARTLRTDGLMTDLQSAQASRDWLQAERLLGLLLAEDPDNADLRAQFADLSRNHSPMVFTRNGGVYVISPDLLDERLVTNEVDAIWPAWSPDRSRIAFFALVDDETVNYGLFTINVDGTGLTRLAVDIHLAGWPIWSPDGTKIAFSSLTPFVLNDQSGITSLHIVDVQTGVETSYTADHFMYATSPTWSPDGTRIAFVSKKFLLGGPAVGSRAEGSLQMLDLTTGVIAPILDGSLPFAQYVTWSPSGNRLLVLSSEVGSAWYQTLISTIDMIDLDSGTLLPITRRSQIVSYPIWAPDGTRFAFVEGDHIIQVRSVDGATSWTNTPREISPFLTWSPDSQALIAPALSPGKASLIVDLATGEAAIDFALTFDYSNQLAGPPQWTAATPLKPTQLPTVESNVPDS